MRYNETPFGFIMVLDPGDGLMAAVMRLARHEEIEAAAIHGLGAVRELELGFHHPAEGAGRSGFDRRIFAGPLEACSLTGTIALSDGEPLVHLHGVFSRPDFSTIGGHVFDAVCHVAVELVLHTAPLALQRSAADFCDLQLMKLKEQP